MDERNDRLETIKQEVGRIPWSELARFFAQGAAIAVSPRLELADVALQFSRDNTPAVQQWMREGSVTHVSDELARMWFQSRATVRAIVVSPWVLVQETGPHQ